MRLSVFPFAVILLILNKNRSVMLSPVVDPWMSVGYFTM